MNEEQKLRQQEYSEKLIMFYNEERKYISALPDYSGFQEKMERIRNSLLESSYCFVQTFDEPLVSHRKGVVGKFVLFIKRVIRKSTRFLLKPYAEKAYRFQTKTLETVGLMVDFLGGLGEESSYEKMSSILENVAVTREAMLSQIRETSEKLLVLNNDVQLKMDNFNNGMNRINNDIQLRMDHLNNDIQLKTNHLNFLEEKTDARYRQILEDINVKTNALSNEAQLKMNHLNFVVEKTEVHYRQIVEDIDLRMRTLRGMGVSTAADSQSGGAFSLAQIISNGKIDISEVRDFSQKFLWAINSDADDPISTYARQGKVVIDPQLLGLFSEPGAFLDIGANIGAFSFVFAASGWNGYAFEASSKNAYVLNNSVSLNNFDVKIIESAIYDKSGEIYFVSDGPWGFVQNDVFADQQYEKINCISLDDWLDTNVDLKAVDFIKIDVEGSEVAVLRGMQGLLKQFDYPPIFIEMNAYALCLQGETQYSMLSFAKSMEYKAYKLKDGILHHYNMDQIPESYITDFMLIKNPPTTLKCSIVEGQAPSEDEIIDMIIKKLSNRTEWNNLSHYGREKDVEEYGAYICYALKDYPQYYERPEIKALLTEIAANNDNNIFVKKAIGWFEQKM